MLILHLLIKSFSYSLCCTILFIAGFGLTQAAISSSNDKLILKSSGQITGSAVSMSGTIVADSGNIGGFKITITEISASDGGLLLKSSGQITASAVSMSGNINASGGDIGGFTIGSSSLFSTNIFISGSPSVGGEHHPKFMFISSSNFNVKQSGDITGSSALFDGNIKVSGTGTIANFVLDNQKRFSGEALKFFV